MTTVLFGNSAPQMQVTQPDGTTISVPAGHINQSETRVDMWEGFDDPDENELALSTSNDRHLSLIGRQLDASEHPTNYAIGINEVEQIVSVHTAGQAPDWVYSDDPEFAAALGAYFNVPVVDEPPNMLLTNTGRDALHGQHLGTTAQPAAFNYLALANSATATTPAATDSTLVGEITTAGGGLVRVQGTYAHTAGTNTSTLTKTFTANASDALPVTISQVGVFNAASAGTMAYKTPMSANATLTVAGDNVAITETINAG